MTEAKAAELQTLRSGSRVLGISADVRDYSTLVAAVERTVKELGRLDYVMCVCSPWHLGRKWTAVNRADGRIVAEQPAIS